ELSVTCFALENPSRVIVAGIVEDVLNNLETSMGWLNRYFRADNSGNGRPWLLRNILFNVDRSINQLINATFSVVKTQGNSMIIVLAIVGVRRLELFKAWW
ncbi:hypothetical protein Goklo_005186, partial [Gossypium klotzschianum]|nr:hypothetical protein [Gossypium klotzschianum]